MNTQLRKTLIAVLDDENGISSIAYSELKSLSLEIAPGENGDIFEAVSSAEGRYYLPEDHGFTADPNTTPPPTHVHVFADCGGYPRCVKCGCDEDDAYVGGEPCN
jgi:hypothetical protein